ncbi:MAG TPA: metal-sensing transcriptional repressor [bacterium]|nr:metal-sensing transcriptional repressor [bacterium]
MVERMKMRPAPKTVLQEPDKPRTHRHEIEERLENLQQTVTRIRCLVEADQNCLDIVKETNQAQAKLKQLALLMVSDRMESCLSSLFFPEKEGDKLIEEIMRALSGFNRNRP